MSSIQADFYLDRETKGALLYKELDDNGRPIESMYAGKIGNVYIRKTAFNGSGFPKKIRINVTTEV
jgi:hypothetical protein